MRLMDSQTAPDSERDINRPYGYSCKPPDSNEDRHVKSAGVVPVPRENNLPEAMAGMVIERPIPRIVTATIASAMSFILHPSQENSFSCPYFVRVHLPVRPDCATATTRCLKRSFR